jgi:hypothetical protein
MVASGRSASQPVGLAPSNDRFQSVNTSWTEICDRHAKANQIMNNHDELFAPYRKIFEYDNRQLTVELIPLYRKMLDVFTEHYWLADSDTRAYYQEFLEFVEVWERFLAESLPRGNGGGPSHVSVSPPPRPVPPLAALATRPAAATPPSAAPER